LRLTYYLSLAFDGVRERRGRSAGAVIGIVIAVAALATALGIGESFSQMFYRSLRSAFGPDLLYVIPKGHLSEADIMLLSSLPNVETVVPVASVAVRLKAGGEVAGVTLYGIKPEQLSVIVGVNDLREVVKEGTPTLVGTSVLVGKYVAYDMLTGVKKLEPGQQIVLEANGKNVMAVVSGILEPSSGPGVAFIHPGSAIFMELETFFRLFRPHRTYQMATVKVADVDRIDETIDLIKAYVPDAEVFSLGFVLEQFNAFMSAVQVFLGAVSGISLAITGLWIFDTMTISVIQRTREIGVLKALGFKKHQIMLLFISESLIITILGVAIGVSLAFALSKVVGLPMFGEVVRPTLSPWIVASVTVLPMLTNLVATLLPAYRAAKLDPVEALRYE